MDARAEALQPKKVYTDAEYKLREAVMDFVLDNDLITQAAIREFKKQKLGSTEYARDTLANLGSKMNLRGLNTAQMTLAKNILRSHQNELIKIYGGEVKASIARIEKREAVKVIVVTPAADTSLNESPDDSDIGF